MLKKRFRIGKKCISNLHWTVEKPGNPKKAGRIPDSTKCSTSTFIPFLTPHLILHNQILQPVLHLYIDITHCIFPIPYSHFLIVLLFLLLLHCYTVYLYTRIKLINVIMLAVPGRTASQCRRTV